MECVVIATLAARGIHVVRNSRKLVDDATFDLNAGECVALLGPNGAGKSTLLRAVAGDIATNAGSVLVHGKTLNQWRNRDLARIRAVLPQHSQVPFAFTVQEVVELGRFPHCAGALAARDHVIVREALSQLHMNDFAYRDITSLSGGERARVHLARVLAQLWDVPSDQSSLLLLDEPTAALDLKYQGQVLGIVKSFARTKRCAVLAVLHDVNLAAQWADRLLWMRSAEIVAQGTPRETMDTAQLRAVYEVSAMMIDSPAHGVPQALVSH
jgi:iron complex transport system ATP-binding protein